MESAAFVCKDLRQIIQIGLAHVPADSRMARAVNLACKCYDDKMPLVDARNAIVADSEDLGWFQAPANVAFAVLGLLYGEGDFSKTICYAVNCGDDTDCTAGTAGAVMGILNGKKAIPAKWLEPIGDDIVVGSFATLVWRPVKPCPRDTNELTKRVCRLAEEAQFFNKTIPLFTDAPTSIPDDYLPSLVNSAAIKRRAWDRLSNQLTYELPFCKFDIIYDDGIEATPGKPMRFRVAALGHQDSNVISIRFDLPEGWEAGTTEGRNKGHFCTSYFVTVTETRFR